MEKKENTIYSEQEVFDASLEYFNGDELAATSFLKKYALKNKNGEYLEKTPDDMHCRLASEFYRIEKKYKNPISYDTIYSYLKDFKYIIPGGSVMFGAGNDFIFTSLSNCVVIKSPEDSISGIMESSKDMANLFKYRCGVGICIDTLRPDGAKVKNSAGTSTGAWSFAEHFSNISRMIGQNGRRAALMIAMNVKHPDIEKFVTMKRDLTKVTGANISVMISDEFMEAVRNQKKWILQWPIDVPLNEAQYTKEIDAEELWNLINESAVKYAEPGIIFIDNYANNLPANNYPNFKSVCTNPCGEVLLSANDTCRLASINLKSFVNNPFQDNCSFDFKKFEETVRVAMHIIDDIVDLEIEKLNNIMDNIDTESEKKLWEGLIKAAENGRRTGLGALGIADALARLKLKYDSDEAIKLIDKIFKCFRDTAYDESVNLAIDRGPFPDFNWEIEKNNIFIKRLPQDIQNKIKENGRRNISLLTIPPTGTIAILCQSSSGLEPVFSNVYTRRVKVEAKAKDENIDFVDITGDQWVEFNVFHKNVKDFIESNSEIKNKYELLAKENKNINEVLEEILPEYFVTAHNIDPIKRVEIQGVISKYLDHGLSSTINLPKNTTIETGKQIYNKAHELGCKGVTIYVDGSRSGVLITQQDDSKIKIASAPKRPKELPCEIHHSTIDGEKWTIFVGLLEGKPYEIFGGLSKYVTIPKKYKTGKIVKIKNGKKNVNGRYAFYNLIIDDGDGDPLEVQNIAVTFDNASYAAQTRMISLALRHGVPVQYISEQLGRDEESEFFSFSKVMARVLKKYIEDGSESSDICEMCGSKLVFEAGCSICKNCSYSPKCS